MACFPAAAAEPAKPRILACKDVNGNPIITDPSDRAATSAAHRTGEEARRG
jgi:hypothetical protein